MYLFTYAYDDDDTNELYSEYHLGRQAFRICKKGTKYCAWHREMPDFKQWRSSCVVSFVNIHSGREGLKKIKKKNVEFSTPTGEGRSKLVHFSTLGGQPRCEKFQIFYDFF